VQDATQAFNYSIGRRGVPSVSITPEQLNDLQRLLNQRYALLSKQVDSELHSDNAKQVSITMPSDADWTTANQDSADQIARVERDVHELAGVETALASIRKGTYGTCIVCSDFIDYSRLVAHPTALRCLSCQERLEAHSGSSTKL
jgi:DnaK suppressor protein